MVGGDVRLVWSIEERFMPAHERVQRRATLAQPSLTLVQPAAAQYRGTIV